MCYPVAYWQDAYHSASPRRQSITLDAAVAEEVARQRQTVNSTGVGPVVLAEGGGGVIKVCLCSPTSHPGSFRCRHHHGEYQWVSRLGRKPS